MYEGQPPFTLYSRFIDVGTEPTSDGAAISELEEAAD